MGGKELKEIKNNWNAFFFLGNDSTPLHSTRRGETQKKQRDAKKTERRRKDHVF